MSASTSMPASRAVVLVASSIVGAGCAYFSFRNGVESFPGQDGYVLGAMATALTVGSWVLLPLAAHASLEGERGRAYILRGGWVLATFFILWASIGFSAGHRVERVEGNSQKIDQYKRAEAQLKAAEADLELAKKDARWAKTSACTNATAELSKAFCGQVAAIRSNISTAQYTLKAGRPGSVDAESDTVAWVASWAGLSVSSQDVGRAKPVIWALIQELMMSLGFYAGLRPSRRREEEEVEAAPVAFEKSVITVTTDAAGAISVAPQVEAVKAVDLTPYIEAAAEAQAALVLMEQAALAWGYAALEAATPLFMVDGEKPAVTEMQKLLPATPKRKATQPATKVTGKKKVRDAKGRFAKKAKLISVEQNPVQKPRLSSVPLGGSENVVIFGSGPKKD